MTVSFIRKKERKRYEHCSGCSKFISNQWKKPNLVDYRLFICH